jgi:hypothetical protein
LLCLGPRDAAATAERESLAALLWVASDGTGAVLEQSPAFASQWPELLDVPAAR